MPTFAFWNTGRNAPVEAVVALVREWRVDILVLAESGIPISDLVRGLNAGGKSVYFPDPGNSTRLTVLTRFYAAPSTLIRDSHGIAIRHYSMPLGRSLLLAAVHLPSKLRKKTEEQILVSTRIARYVREAEQQVGHRRTVLIGDLNMNPFEVGVVGSDGLHAIMDRRIAAGGSRVVDGEDCHFFYNPMWGVFGDNKGSPPGTYYRNTGSQVNYFWNVFDQVLVRPSLLPYLVGQPIEVVTELAGTSLLTGSGRPDHHATSDHLPVVCRLNEILEDSNVD
jgi:hypothetical protein